MRPNRTASYTRIPPGRAPVFMPSPLPHRPAAAEIHTLPGPSLSPPRRLASSRRSLETCKTAISSPGHGADKFVASWYKECDPLQLSCLGRRRHLSIHPSIIHPFQDIWRFPYYNSLTTRSLLLHRDTSFESIRRLDPVKPGDFQRNDIVDLRTLFGQPPTEPPRQITDNTLYPDPAAQTTQKTWRGKQKMASCLTRAVPITYGTTCRPCPAPSSSSSSSSSPRLPTATACSASANGSTSRSSSDVSVSWLWI